MALLFQVAVEARLHDDLVDVFVHGDLEIALDDHSARAKGALHDAPVLSSAQFCLHGKLLVSETVTPTDPRRLCCRFRRSVSAGEKIFLVVVIPYQSTKVVHVTFASWNRKKNT